MNAELYGRQYDIEPLKNPSVKPSNEVLFIHCRGFELFDDLKPILKQKLIDGFEYKLEKFKGENALSEWKGNRYCFNNNFSQLVQMTLDNDLKSQFHLPIEDIEGKFLDISNLDDQRLLLDVFKTYAENIDKYNLGKNVNITVHPPNAPDHNNLEEVNYILSSTNHFLIKLGEKIKEEKWPIVICLENQPDPKINFYKADSLGYLKKHFEILTKDTNEFIQFCVDSGHRKLTEKFKIQDLVDWCPSSNKYISNFHIHSNDGIRSDLLDNKKSSDLHLFPNPEKIHGYLRFFLRAVYENIPLNLEIAERKPTIEQIKPYRETIDYVYNRVLKTG